MILEGMVLCVPTPVAVDYEKYQNLFCELLKEVRDARVIIESLHGKSPK